MKVAVVGLGYVGIPVAAVLASKRVRVVGVDIDLRKIDAISAGRSPLEGREPGLDELVAKGVAAGHFTATSDYGAADGSDAIVGSLAPAVGDRTHPTESEDVPSALRSVALHIARGGLVSVESPLARGTMA